MYFWRIEHLKRDLTTRPLNDREVLPYLLIFVGLTALVQIFPVESMNIWDYVFAIGSVLLTIGGTIYTYQCNRASAGLHFVQRYLAIGWVVGVRWGVIVLPAFVAMSFFVDTFVDGTTPTYVLFWLIAEVVLYGRMGHHIRAVANAPLQSNSTVESDLREAARVSQ